MKKQYVQYCVILLLLLLPMSALAQFQAIFGTTTSTSSTTFTGSLSPYQRYWGSGKNQYLIRATELTSPTSGNPLTSGSRITDIAFFVNQLSGDVGTNWRISIGHTNLTQFTNTTYLNGGTQVFGPVTINYVNGLTLNAWNNYTFTSPFTWNGVDNIFIEVCDVNSGWPTHPSVLTQLPGYNCSLGGNGCTSGAFNGCNMTTTAGCGSVGLQSSRPIMRLTFTPAGIESSFPEDIDPRRILQTTLYDGNTLPKPSVTVRRLPSQGTLNYRIYGPLPSNTLVYQALNSTSLTDTSIVVTGGSGLVTQTFNFATGSLAGTNGALDTRNATGGAYRLEVFYSNPTANLTQQWTKQFIIALQNDLAITRIDNPRIVPFRYLRGIPLPLSCQVQNVGLNSVTSFQVVATVRDASNAIVKMDTVTYSGAPMATGDVFNAVFSPFTTNSTGFYTASFEVLFGADNSLANNVQPQTGSHTFEVQFLTELSTDAILNPVSNEQVVVNRPVVPTVRYRNNGASDQSDIPTRIAISRFDNGNWVPVTTLNSVAQDIPYTGNAIGLVSYSAWTPTVIGRYRFCASITAFDDPVRSNDTLCQEFDVIDAMNGTFTIGTTNSGARNFTTIQGAVDALYSRGVSGAVVFELTDPTYTVGSLTNSGQNGALDLSSRILGVSNINTITFKPALEPSLTRGSINIELRTPNGRGIVFGQNQSPSNPNAVMSQIRRVDLYANSAGYIRFDGGSFKSFRFQLNVGSATPQTLPHRSVFYLGRGTQNITVMNSLIENHPQSQASYAMSLPMVRYNAPIFVYEDDVRPLSSGPESYSAGITNRASVPNQGASSTPNNQLAMDTIANSNNTFEGNEIRGFGYGIVSLGMGPLFYNDIAPNGNPRFQRYYNANTRIVSNLISDVRRAGIYTGYGESETITNNRVVNVGIGSTGQGGMAAGIMLGGQVRPGLTTFTYNNVRTLVARNEISNITSDSAATGILLEQTPNSYLNPLGGNVVFPNIDERNRIAGNIIYGVDGTTQIATRAGIHVTTSRTQASVPALTRLLTPLMVNYFTRGDSIINNTIIMNNANVSNGASMVCLGIQHGQASVVMNNALGLSGSSGAVNTAAGNIYANMFYQGIQPKQGGLNSNRNAYYIPGMNNAVLPANTTASVVRMVEIDATSQVLESGSQDEFRTLGQWKAWTSQDVNSVVGDFVKDYQLNTSVTPSRYRVKTSPLPLGSILDRRGDRFGFGQNDIDGDVRGLNGSRYTIGADEFIGDIYVNDIEAIEVLNPVSYRATSGTFSDAEYIMTTAPANVTARMRNGGAASMSNVSVTTEIFMQQGDGSMSSSPMLTKSQTMSLQAGESGDVDFGLAGNSGNFTPMSFSQLGSGYAGLANSLPQFSTMLSNVTPLYRIRVYTTGDQNRANDTVVKDVRFYLIRSGLKMVTSTVSSNAVLSGLSPINAVVGRLNNDSLQSGLRQVAFSGGYDVFERSGWEPRAVNYVPYRTMLWAEDTSRLTRQQRVDMRLFANSGTAQEKHNLIVASQEIVGKHIGLDAFNDEGFVRYTLRAVSPTRSTPTGTATTPRAAGYDAFNVIGRTLARGITARIQATGNALDPNSGASLVRPSLMRVYSDNQTVGLSSAAYGYVSPLSSGIDSVMGVATSSSTSTTVFLGVDWRHFARVDQVLRGVIEFVERSSGIVVPVELVDFTAVQRSGKVDISWQTASEKNSSHYVIERSEKSLSGQSEYVGIATLRARGNSSVVENYGSTDANVIRGNEYIYRLKMVDLDGSHQYSNEVLVRIDGNGMMVNVEPNPVGEVAIVRMNVVKSGSAEVLLYDNSGRMVRELYRGEMSSGEQSVSMSSAGLASGVYTVVIKIGSESQSQRVTIVK